jgi:hypothetical protein
MAHPAGLLLIEQAENTEEEVSGPFSEFFNTSLKEYFIQKGRVGKGKMGYTQSTTTPTENVRTN